jgi:uncharacterized protein (TIGR00299 family) protein
VTAAAVGWLDCSAGVSGDMLLGALDELGALDGLATVLDALPLRAGYVSSSTRRGALQATRISVEAAGGQPERRLVDVLAILAAAPVPRSVRDRAAAVFHRLAVAEAAVHGLSADDVHFHEVGGIDSIVDVLGVCFGVDALALGRLTTSPIALGSGTAATEHGPIPVPGPAVLELLARSSLVAHGGPGAVELATPTGVALLAELSDETSDLPAMHVTGVGIGAGSRDFPDRPNVVRFVVGRAATASAGDDGADWLLLEANVDDLDPRLWPTVIDALLAVGAADAWLTPILMKKGRPAHTVSALATATAADQVRDVLFRESTTIGIRTTSVAKHALDRTWVDVDVDGQPIRVKVASLAGEPVGVTPEWDDVAAAARALSRPAKLVLAAAVAAAHSAVR